MNEFTFKTHDGTDLNITVWDNVTEPRGVVQIFHGMAEHAARYAHFAEYLNSYGFIVYADDHRAHGKSCPDPARIGCVSGDVFEQTVRDEQALSDMILEKHKLSLWIFTHSYGSFIGQKYIQSYGGKIAGIVLSGSGRVQKALLLFGKMLAKNRRRKMGADYVSPMIIKSSLGSYGKRFGGGNNWLTSIKEEVEKYDADPLCGADFSCGFYYYFFRGLSGLYTKEGLAAIPKDLPILIMSGSMDPVGDYGKGVKRLHKTYTKQNLNVSLKLFEGGRHEMLNEEERAEVFELVKNFFIKQ